MEKVFAELYRLGFSDGKCGNEYRPRLPHPLDGGVMEDASRGIAGHLVAALEEERRLHVKTREALNAALVQISQRDSYVRHFSAEYGCATYGRRGEQMKPGTVGTGVLSMLAERIKLGWKSFMGIKL